MNFAFLTSEKNFHLLLTESVLTETQFVSRTSRISLVTAFRKAAPFASTLRIVCLVAYILQLALLQVQL